MMINKINMGDVAMFVASSLNYPIPQFEGRRFVSTIRVNQFKTKFGHIRIYCQLASPALVQDAWSALGKEGEPTAEWIENRLRNDALHYRDCYLSMAKILSCVPDGDELITYLVDSSDYRELLYPNKDALNDMIIGALESDSINYYYTKWGVSDSDQLLQRLSYLCGMNKPPRGLFE